MDLNLTAIILAGGKGLRMSHDLPKPLVPIRGKALLAHQIDYLKSRPEVKNIIIGLSHRAGEVEQYIKNTYPDSAIASVAIPSSRGTAETLFGALDLVQPGAKEVLVLNCDDLADLDVRELAALGPNSIAVAHPTLPFGLITEEAGRAVFLEKPKLDSWVNMGWYLLNPVELSVFQGRATSLERDVFPEMKLKVYRHQGAWHTFNTDKDVETFERGNDN